MKIIKAEHTSRHEKKPFLVSFEKSEEGWRLKAGVTGAELRDYPKFQAAVLNETGQLYSCASVEQCHSQRDERAAWRPHVEAMLDPEKRKSLPKDCNCFAPLKPPKQNNSPAVAEATVQ